MKPPPTPQIRIDTFSALGLILITLKLIDKVDLSWWLVLAPCYAPIVLCLVILLIEHLTKSKSA